MRKQKTQIKKSKTNVDFTRFKKNVITNGVSVKGGHDWARNERNTGDG